VNISVPCPEGVRINAATLHKLLPSIPFKVEDALLAVEVAGDRLLERLESLTKIQGEIVSAILDANEGTIIAALGQLKATVAGLEPIVRHESSYTVAQQDNAPEQVEEAIDETVISHPTASQNASSEGSSEQHGAVTDNLNEENVNVETQQEERSPRRRRAAGRE
jgi:hypothetical protein